MNYLENKSEIYRKILEKIKKSEFEKLERGLSSRDGVKSFYIILNMYI